MEKVVLRQLWEGPLKAAPLHSNQHAYIAGKSCDTALHQVVGKIEKALDVKEVALAAFLDVQGAFDCTKLQFILRAIRGRGVDEVLCNWIGSLLGQRSVLLKHLGKSLEVRTTRGFPQGGVLSPVLWNMVVDGLIRRLDESGVFVQGYADDLVIMVTGKFENTVSELLSRALKIVDRWCEEAGLTINPDKVVVVPFTRRRKLEGMVPLRVQNTTVRLGTQVKYLGVTLDQRLQWTTHRDRVIERGRWAVMTCKRLVGRTWGLSPKLMQWTFVSMVRPALLHGALVWWPCTEVRSTVRSLGSLQRMAELAVTGAVSSAPGAALDCCLNLPPLDIVIRAAARRSAYRLEIGKLWKGGGLGHSRITAIISGDGTLAMISDHMVRRYSFYTSFQTVIPDRLDWQTVCGGFLSADLVWYTDGSKTADGTGAGVHGKRPSVELSIPMGMYPTVFQAEVTALLECGRVNLQLGYNGKSISIFTDSQAALTALAAQEFSSRLVWDCHRTLSILGRRNEVTLIWVPGHSGIEGNEAADALANRASATGFMGPEPFCGISRCVANRAISAWVVAEHTLRWKRVDGLRMSKMVLQGPSSHLAESLLRMDRGNLRNVVGMITGHGHWRKHLHRMGIYEEDPVCRKCGQEEESAEHLLFECEALALARRVVFGPMTKESGFCQEDLAGNILRFVRLMGITGR